MIEAKDIERITQNIQHLLEYSLEDVEQLALTYPNVQSFQVYKAYLAKAKNDAKEQKFLSKAAIYSTDRSRLFEVMNNQLEILNPAGSELQEETLELDILEEINGVNANVAPYQLEENEEEIHLDTASAEQFELDEDESLPGLDEVANTIASIKLNSKRVEKKVDFEDFDDKIEELIDQGEQALADTMPTENIADEEEITVEMETASETEQETPIAETTPGKEETTSTSNSPKSFGDWMKQFNNNTETKVETAPVIEEVTQEISTEESIDSEKDLEEPTEEAAKIDENLTSSDINVFNQFKKEKVSKPKKNEHFGLVTETLAKILEKQQNYSKAIEIYEQLSLENPKKSAYFADRIKELKNKE